jgi:hypothetical protein
VLARYFLEQVAAAQDSLIVHLGKAREAAERKRSGKRSS